MDSMAGTFNYTWSVAKQSEEDWGVTPKNTGDGLQAHDYVGVLVSVVYPSGVPNLWVSFFLLYNSILLIIRVGHGISN